MNNDNPDDSTLREHRAFACSGWLFLLIMLVVLGYAGYHSYQSFFVKERFPEPSVILCAVIGVLLLKGLFTLQPNQSMVASFFGAYVGTIRGAGLKWTIPFFGRQRVSVRSHNLNTPTLKVNDKKGNPIEIASAVVWRVRDTAKAIYEVEDYHNYVDIQSESAVRRLASEYPYDSDGDDHSGITLRDGGDTIAEALRTELEKRLAPAGIEVQEARVTHLAYAQEIAQAMLRRQQAEAIIAARTKIVKGAVDIVEMALADIHKNEIVSFDEDRKAAMVSNLLVVLCGESEVTPVVNTGA